MVHGVSYEDINQMPIFERLWFCGRYDRRDQDIEQARRDSEAKARK